MPYFNRGVLVAEYWATVSTLNRNLIGIPTMCNNSACFHNSGTCCLESQACDPCKSSIFSFSVLKHWKCVLLQPLGCQNVFKLKGVENYFVDMK